MGPSAQRSNGPLPVPRSERGTSQLQTRHASNKHASVCGGNFCVVAFYLRSALLCGNFAPFSSNKEYQYHTETRAQSPQRDLLGRAAG